MQSYISYQISLFFFYGVNSLPRSHFFSWKGGSLCSDMVHHPPTPGANEMVYVDIGAVIGGQGRGGINLTWKGGWTDMQPLRSRDAGAGFAMVGNTTTTRRFFFFFPLHILF